MNRNFNRIANIGLVFLGLANLLMRDVGMAGAVLGLALAFDPFDTQQPWGERSVIQKTWLLALLAATLGLIAYSIIARN